MASALEIAGHEVVRIRLPATPARRGRRPGRWEPARLARPLVAALGVDAILLPRGAVLASHLRADAPVVLLPDSDLDPGLEIARRALARADLVVFPTRSDAAAALRAGYVESGRAHGVPWGADIAPSSEPAPRRRTAPIHMLLVGADWTGESADVALGAMVELQRRRLAAGLTVVGCTPPSVLDVEGLTVLPGFDRRQAGHRRQLSRLYEEATVLVLPSRDPTAVGLLREAMAHGLPFVASDLSAHREVAGLTAGCTIVPAGARPAAWADAIASACLDPVAHARSCRAVYAAYGQELDWARWAERLVAALATVVTRARPTARPRR
jgi:glycosyltransferase involved in cell wall biosynthesis